MSEAVYYYKGVKVELKTEEKSINGSATIDHETARKRRFVAVEK
jgi:hypothetical protein